MAVAFNIFLIAFIFFIYGITHIKKFKNADVWFLRIVFFTLFFLVSIRTMQTGSDTINYYYFFNSFNRMGIAAIHSRIEVESGYIILNILCGLIMPSYRFLIVVISAIIYILIYKFIKNNSKDYLFSTLFFTEFLFFYGTMNIVRQYLALAIAVCFSYKYAKEKKLLKFIFSVIIACLFHATAIIVLLYYPIVNMKFSKSIMLIILVITIIATFFIGDLINIAYTILNRTSHYSNKIGSVNIASILHVFIYGFIFVFTLLFMKKYNKFNDEYMYILLLVFSLCFMAINMNVFERVALYYRIHLITIIPNIINYMKSYRKKLYLKTTVLLFLMSYAFVIMLFRPEWNTAYNYESILFL